MGRHNNQIKKSSEIVHSILGLRGLRASFCSKYKIILKMIGLRLFLIFLLNSLVYNFILYSLLIKINLIGVINLISNLRIILYYYNRCGAEHVHTKSVLQGRAITMLGRAEHPWSGLASPCCHPNLIHRCIHTCVPLSFCVDMCMCVNVLESRDKCCT